MSDDDEDSGSVSKSIRSSLIGMQKAAATAGASDQLDNRQLGITVGNGLSPPYPPDRLASLQELNGTHAVAVGKKAKREVGFGFDLVAHPRTDNPSEEEREIVEDFWLDRNSTWKTGPKGTPASTPTEVFELARQDYHGIGWLAIEILYNGFADQPGGLAYLPSKTVRVKKKIDDGSYVDDQVAGHGYVQKRNGRTRYFAEGGARHQTDADGNEDPRYVDRETGDVYESVDAMRAAGAKPANELLYIPNPHGNTLYYGLPTWISEIQTMVADQEARRYNRKRLENDLMLDYVIIVEGGELSEDSREDIREHIDGLRESDGPGAWILEPEDLADSGIDVDDSVSIRVEPMTQPGQQDMDWEQFRELNERDIAKAHNIPLQALSRHDATNSNTSAALREFTKEFIEPNQESFAERLYRIIHQQILDVSDWTINFVTKGGEDELRQAEIGALAADSAAGQAMTAGQALDLFGLEADETVEGMLLAELGRSGGLLEQAIEEQVQEASDRQKAASRIEAASSD